MKKFIAIICICVASILALTGCSQIFMSKPKIQTIMKIFESERASFITIADYLKGLSYSSCFIDDQNGFFFADFKYHEIYDSAVIEAIKCLWACGCTHISKNSNNNSIAFELWSNNQEIDGGILTCIHEGEEAKVEYMTEIQEIPFPNWYYYVEDYNKWRVE